MEAVQAAARSMSRRCDVPISNWLQRKCRALAKVAMARKLAVRLYWMLRLQVNYAQMIQGSNAGQPGTFCGRG